MNVVRECVKPCFVQWFPLKSRNCASLRHGQGPRPAGGSPQRQRGRGREDTGTEGEKEWPAGEVSSKIANQLSCSFVFIEIPSLLTNEGGTRPTVGQLNACCVSNLPVALF